MYWTILNCWIYNKKLPTIPPLHVGGKLVSDFCEKANIFNNFFSLLYASLSNSSRHSANADVKKQNHFIIDFFLPLQKFKTAEIKP